MSKVLAGVVIRLCAVVVLEPMMVAEDVKVILATGAVTRLVVNVKFLMVTIPVEFVIIVESLDMFNTFVGIFIIRDNNDLHMCSVREYHLQYPHLRQRRQSLCLQKSMMPSFGIKFLDIHHLFLLLL